MQVHDFPFGMRLVLVLGILFFAANVIVFASSITALVVLLSEKGAGNPAWWTLVGTVVGSILGSGGAFFVTRRMALENRQKEATDIAVSLHAEIADRVARCLNDYLAPWQSYNDAAEDT
jgi:hypothetical protein